MWAVPDGGRERRLDVFLFLLEEENRNGVLLKYRKKNGIFICNSGKSSLGDFEGRTFTCE